ncbi:MAG: hypothetical protein KatS3mg024_2712 [Armatimonadota bacterium]|nr:MAG: hypothetical protein KatS3mg024_2712 [Armatimonadota bacterium]
MHRSLTFRLNGALAAAVTLAVALSAAGEIRAAAIHEAAKKGDTAAIGMLLDKDAALVNARDREHQGAYEVVGKDWTPLHWAAYSGQARAATVLLDRGADPKALTLGEGFQPAAVGPRRAVAD